MNSPDKKAILHIAHSFLLDAVGIMSCPISPLLLEKLSSSGPVPFVPDDMHQRISPESLLPGTKSIIVILFPYGYKSEKSANIALYARTKDYHKIVHTYLENIIEELKKYIKKRTSMPLQIHLPWRTDGLLTRPVSDFSGKITA